MAALDSQYSVVLVTAPNEEIAREIASQIVGEHLAACVNIVPGLVSIYEWKDKVEESREVLLIVKTKSDTLARLTEKVVSMHPYEVPEVIGLPVTAGSKPYLDWIDSVVKSEISQEGSGR